MQSLWRRACKLRLPCAGGLQVQPKVVRASLEDGTPILGLTLVKEDSDLVGPYSCQAAHVLPGCQAWLTPQRAAKAGPASTKH